MAKEWHYLRAIDREVVIPPIEPLIFDPEIPGAEEGTLRGGDCDNDNRINIQDFGILARFFGEVYELPGVIPPPLKPDPHPWHADVNGDLRINIKDFGILASNFGEIGVGGVDAIAAPSTPSGANFTAVIRPEVRMENLTFNNFIEVPLSKEFELNIIAENVVDLHGYSFNLSYDSSRLQVQRLKEGFAQEGEFLKHNPAQKPTLFLARDFSKQGSSVKRIILSGCIIGAEEGVSGRGTVANLRLKLSSPKHIHTRYPIARPQWQSQPTLRAKGNHPRCATKKRSTPIPSILTPGFPTSWQKEMKLRLKYTT